MKVVSRKELKETLIFKYHEPFEDKDLAGKTIAEIIEAIKKSGNLKEGERLVCFICKRGQRFETTIEVDEHYVVRRGETVIFREVIESSRRKVSDQEIVIMVR